jgi:hypothetical protein
LSSLAIALGLLTGLGGRLALAVHVPSIEAKGGVKVLLLGRTRADASRR